MKTCRSWATIVLALLEVLMFDGCAVPAPQGPTYSASYIGDRVGQALEEMVFTITLPQGSGTELRNLHVRMDAMVNPKDLSITSIYEVTDIVRRLEPRIRARVVELVPPGKSVSLQSLPDLKSELAREAQAAFSASYAKWTKASTFDVQIVVASFYLTDLSVGTPPPAKRAWW